MKTQPTYPIYIPSRGRFENNHTAKLLLKDKTPFKLVVEPSEVDEYSSRYGAENILVLPCDNFKLVNARNWIKDHATAEGHKRHWQLDDNIRHFLRMYRATRINCNASIAMFSVEQFVDRYTNIAIAGMNYDMFAFPQGNLPPFNTNCHVYSCSLVSNEIPHRWRLVYNDDTDLCLQVLSSGLCTVLFNAFLCDKIATMKVRGGNTPIYQDDGRLKMSRMLERVWPGVVTTGRRFNRAQHIVKSAWRKFDTKLIRREDIDWNSMEQNEFGMKVKQIAEKIKHPAIQKLVDEASNING